MNNNQLYKSKQTAESKDHFFIKFTWKIQNFLKLPACLRAGRTEICGLFEEILKADGFSKLLL